MKKRFACLFLALMLAFGAAASAESVKVGLIAPLTGEVAVYGNAVKEAVQLYIDDFNAADHPSTST